MISVSEAGFPDLREDDFVIGSDDNDKITGLFSGEDSLIIFKENNIYKIYTDQYNNITNWSPPERVVTGIGLKLISSAFESSAVVQLPAGDFIFLGQNNVIYRWAGAGEPVRISDKIQVTLNSLIFTNVDMAYDSKRNWVWFTYSTSSVSGDWFIYDLNINSWLPQKINTDGTKGGSATALGIGAPFQTKEGELILGGPHRYIMKYNTGITQDNLATSGAPTAFGNYQINTRFTTKVWDKWMIVKQILMKIVASTTGSSSGISITPKVNGSNVTAKTSQMVGQITRVDIRTNYNAKEFSFTFENYENLAFNIKEMAVVYEPAHTESAT